ncbi:hypothetical protein GMOD_00008589 [Pyrenophora seminiperda CCB06]|uniref:Uncharacterized protein n=1 Tax=Pyrenophora seminiperda CCB06 TaxID=1302712 RepID=A0A3M7M8W2_9PLEO|nr:hypothetical protein GMOD_00008589 [Pyrenophora seminiperda CCB06]
MLCQRCVVRRACSRACTLPIRPSTFCYQHLVETAAYPDPELPVLIFLVRMRSGCV